jgi:predicted acyl esterase
LIQQGEGNMTTPDSHGPMRRGTPPEQSGYPGRAPRTERIEHFIAEYDVEVPLRDGGVLLIDVFRPIDEGVAVAPLVAWGPYGKHSPLKFDLWPGVAVEEGALSPYTAFEAPDPWYWTRHGYAVINVDPRGTWGTPGEATFLSRQEGEDYYDLIEWAGTRPWSNGRVGLAGVSYLGMSQWQVAAMNPPHLAAINPWEALSDAYRELAFHGGIPETQFLERWQQVSSYSLGNVEDLVLAAVDHPLDDDYWRGKVADLSKVRVPAYVLVGWADQACHTRGSLDAFAALASEQKWLDVYAGKKLQMYYDRDYVSRQKAFFDRFLREVDSDLIDDWPRVRLEISASTTSSRRVTRQSWPPADTQYETLRLDIGSGRLVYDAPVDTRTATYDSTDPDSSLRFRYTFDRDTDIVGHSAVRLWMSASAADDLDVFVALEKYDRDGQRVPFHYLSNFEDGAVALGWLRGSHRELDAERSTPWRPRHPHTSEDLPGRGSVVPLDIEIWPSASHFSAGESIELQVQGSDIHRYAIGFFAAGHPLTRNSGEHVLYAGGAYDSTLVLPVLPSTP